MLTLHEMFNNFFKSLTIFKRHTKNKFFILSMRKKFINLIFEKQFIAAENRKQINSKLTFNKNFIFFNFRINMFEFVKNSFHIRFFLNLDLN